eukprot:6906304-Pyramimonas_sp.AAC.1
MTLRTVRPQVALGPRPRSECLDCAIPILRSLRQRSMHASVSFSKPGPLALSEVLSHRGTLE